MAKKAAAIEADHTLATEDFGAKLVAPHGSGWLIAAGCFVAIVAFAGLTVRLRDGARVASVARVD